MLRNERAKMDDMINVGNSAAPEIFSGNRIGTSGIAAIIDPVMSGKCP